MLLPRLTLVSHKLCPYVQRARIVLDEKAIPHEIKFIDLKRKPKWFLALSPLGKVPVLLVNDMPIFESAVIAEYLDEITPGSLHPEDPLHKAVNRSWIEFASSTLAAIGAFYSAADASAFNARVSVLTARFRRLDAELQHVPFFNGENFSLVDAAFGPVFRYFDVVDRHVDLGIFKETSRANDYRMHLSHRPSVRNAVVSDYPQRLHQFFLERNSYLTNLIISETAGSQPVLM